MPPVEPLTRVSPGSDQGAFRPWNPDRWFGSGFDQRAFVPSGHQTGVTPPATYKKPRLYGRG